MTAVLPAAHDDTETRADAKTTAWTLPEVRWAGAATILFLAGLAAKFAGGPAGPHWTLFLACYAAGGWEPGLAGLRALREKSLDVDLLMVAAAIGAAAVGQVLDGGLLIVIFATSGALEALATHQTERAVRGLLDLAPDTAVLLQPDGSERTVDAASLNDGDLILVRPGDRIAADGKVMEGVSDVDQATITGEPLPAPKEPGHDVFAGTLNGSGVLTVRVGSSPADFVIARIVAMVTEASQTKARTQLFIEKIEQRYSVAMVTATVALFVAPLLLGDPLRASLLRAMTFMIVASPCAVVLATMPPLLAAMANAGRHGVLVKSAVVMEETGTAGIVAFDKTGTLTEGTPRLAAIRVLPGSDLAEREILALAAGAENPSEHPLALAVVTAARDTGVAVPPATEFTARPGRGVAALVNGRKVEIGRPGRRPGEAANPATAGPTADPATGAIAERLTEQATNPVTEPVAERVAELEADGQTAAVVTIDGRAAAVFGIADRLRPAAAAAVREITALTGTSPVLLTGDNERAARKLAEQAGIDDVRAGLLPEDKVTAVRELEAAGRKVLLAGDGVNDAPALAAASTGAAMGRAGSDLALDTADLVIMRDDLAAIPGVIALSRRAHRVVTANLWIAAAIIAGLVSWDLAGHLPLPLGVLGHEGSTVIVGLNGLRLLRANPWHRAREVIQVRPGVRFYNRFFRTIRR